MLGRSKRLCRRNLATGMPYVFCKQRDMGVGKEKTHGAPMAAYPPVVDSKNEPAGFDRSYRAMESRISVTISYR